MFSNKLFSNQLKGIKYTYFDNNLSIIKQWELYVLKLKKCLKEE